ncbi:hypothetical protein LZ575_11490 [Antarcticibacterium sp. 1MA-6-2]|uniref:hypothetical protein n=1 Tax=Antarcticibacterium sp. 1MA-6-2 TaxID=2908210 RepID=UPI001F2B9C1E|nr:hypothetical protein [Antarcticibacterium sp. 1MA-6-2]UJH89690.1 hypothetical protein LZ575_11490 [Antarcticibacterium sp. 1MA-6-2]
MKLINISSKNILFFIAPVSFLLLASCSSYQYSGYEDGIYGETNRPYDRQNQNATQDSDRSYYKNLFAEEAALYGEVLAEDAIFTDVESYSSTGEYNPNDQQQGYVGGNAPWGEDPDSYQINIYNNGFYGGFYNPYWAGGMYAFDPYWGPYSYWGPGYYGPYNPWRHGYYGGHWGNSWSIGFGGFHGGFYGYGGHPFYGGGWYNPYNYYGNRYNSFRHSVAYNTGRRDAASYYNNRSNTNSVRNAASLDSRGRNSSYSRSIRNLRNSNDDYGVTRRTVSREYQTRSNTDYNSNTRSRVYDAGANRRSNTYSAPTRSNSSTVRSNSSSTRSSGTVRSSSPAPRSSGTVRSSGGGRSSSGGRGN